MIVTGREHYLAWDMKRIFVWDAETGLQTDRCRWG